MSFKSIAEYIDKIEQGFLDKQSPETIARTLGIPDKAKTIRRYKAAVWDLKDVVSDAKEVRAAKHDAKRDQAVNEAVDTLEVINLGKLRAKQILKVSLGDKFKVSDGAEHELTLGSASVYWPVGTKILSDVVNLEMKLAGDDPESRKASAIEELGESDLRAILEALDTAEKGSSTK